MPPPPSFQPELLEPKIPRRLAFESLHLRVLVRNGRSAITSFIAFPALEFFVSSLYSTQELSLFVCVIPLGVGHRGKQASREGGEEGKHQEGEPSEKALGEE